MFRESQQTGRMRLHQLAERNKSTGDMMSDLRDRYQCLARPESSPAVVSSFNLFQTPEPLAARIAAMLPLNGRVLEPSAGLGRLYRAIRARSDASVVMVEQSQDCCRELYREIELDDAATLIQADFFACDVSRLGGMFDSVLMNPPFKNGVDVKHIRHALAMLAPGGTLVSLCAAGPRQRKMLSDCDSWIPLPLRSFASEGTGVDAAIVCYVRDN